MKRIVDQRRLMVERTNERLSLSEQCRLLSLHRSGLYYQACPENEQNLELMKLIDEFLPCGPLHRNPKDGPLSAARARDEGKPQAHQEALQAHGPAGAHSEAEDQ